MILILWKCHTLFVFFVHHFVYLWGTEGSKKLCIIENIETHTKNVCLFVLIWDRFIFFVNWSKNSNCRILHIRNWMLCIQINIGRALAAAIAIKDSVLHHLRIRRAIIFKHHNITCFFCSSQYLFVLFKWCCLLRNRQVHSPRASFFYSI